MSVCDLKNEDELMELVKEFLLQVKGVEDVLIISDEDKKTIEQLEEEAKGNVLMGMGEGDNQGIAEVFKREHILCFTTNKEYIWPEPPNVIMMQGGEMIGFDCAENEICTYENDPDYMIMGTFVMNKAKTVGNTGKPIVVLPPKPYNLGEIEVEDVVLGSPSTPSDEYIREAYNFEKSNEKGTFFLGFNKIKCLD
ncbi:hypothetical protein MmiAt1_14780 [Methanimicrococcus sp. At1]|uniref:Uncharacterized protein n=1 Tax=Methanimicrococcus hacksteinii TaxID=3028293 RepID=A0ABU3VR50_9EURY|nr:hypothetical protein [Methanimicrococcus sp. At1]MDV0445877.1 hypothetical protein [Methanimicrococcus sp. At1]